jgi:16S rRNA (cytosine1407-C5)-methyltransferase
MKRKKIIQAPVVTTNPQEDSLERFLPLLPEADQAALLADLQIPLRQSLRVNPHKTRPDAIHEWAARYGWTVESIPYCPTGWRVEPSPEGTLPSATIEHRLGQFYILDAASMLPVELFEGLEEADQPLILDLAASPGGKTTHLAARSGERGLVMANDSSAERITALRLVLQGWGAPNTAVSNFPGERFGQWFPETFDFVLLDAPCSMQGLRATDAHPLRPITAREQSSLARRQTQLLESALRAVKTGGQVVYSTCTLSPEEDEGVLDALLKRYPGSLEIAELNLPVPAPGLTKVDGISFDPQVKNAARLWPHLYHTAGFFAALIRKVNEIPVEPIEPPFRPLEKASFFPLEHKELQALAGMLQQDYDLDLLTLLDQHSLTLYRRNRLIFAFPELFLSRFGDFQVQAAGLLFAEETPEGLLPAVEFVNRFWAKFRGWRCDLPDEWLTAWLRGEDIPLQSCLPTGRMIVMQDGEGRYLGRGRAAGDKIKNLGRR